MVDVGERWAEKTNEAEQGTAWHHYQGRPDCTAPRPPRTLRNHRRPPYVCGLHVHFILHPRVIVWVILSHDGVARYLRNRKYIQYKRWQIVVMYVYLMFQLVFSCVCVCVCMCVYVCGWVYVGVCGCRWVCVCVLWYIYRGNRHRTSTYRNILHKSKYKYNYTYINLNINVPYFHILIDVCVYLSMCLVYSSACGTS